MAIDDFESRQKALANGPTSASLTNTGEAPMATAETANIAIHAALTGHLVLSTLHTNDSVSAITRLYNMGIEPFLLAYSLNIIVAQRLVRKLCDRCKAVATDVAPSALAHVGFPAEEIASTTFYHAVGCMYCVKGYKGRTAIHEALYFTPEIRELIMDSDHTIHEQEIRRVAIKQGMKTLRDAGLDLVRKGVTSLEEIATGDAGHFDEDGYLWIMGRVDDVVNAVRPLFPAGALVVEHPDSEHTFPASVRTKAYEFLKK